MATPKTTINMHPKVFVALLIGIGISLVTGAAAVITPDVFAPLGQWGPAAFTLATTGLAWLGAWLKGAEAKESVAPAPVVADASPDEAEVAPDPTDAPAADTSGIPDLSDLPADVPAPVPASAAVAGTQSTVIETN